MKSKIEVMKSHLFTRNFIWLLLLLFIAVSCQKDSSQVLDTQKKGSLSDVKDLYAKEGIANKINPKDNIPIQWEPLWDEATVRKANDSVEYMFIPLHPYLKDDKKKITFEKGGKTYLLVKNGKEFYKGFFFNDTKEEITDLRSFTGKMLFTNLKSNAANLIKYRNGSPYFEGDENVQKKRASSTKMAWEQNCNYQTVDCIYQSGGYGCGSGITIYHSRDCSYPSFCAGYGWSLIDSRDEYVCENVWVPDAPGTGDGGGGDDNNYTITNNVQNPCMKGMVDEIINKDIVFKANETLNSIFNINGKFNVVFNQSTSLGNNVNGNAIPTQTYYDSQGNISGMDIDIKLNVNNLPSSSQEYIAMVVVHESIHAYLDYKGFAYNTNQHDIMLKDYVDVIANYLVLNFNTPERDAYSVAFGGLFDAFQNSINNQTWESIKTKLGNKLPSLDERSRILADYETGHKGAKCQQTP